MTDEWETIPQDELVFTVGPRGGRRYLTSIPAGNPVARRRTVRAVAKWFCEGGMEWPAIGLSVTDESQAEVYYFSLSSL